MNGLVRSSARSAQSPQIDTARRFEAANPGVRLYIYRARTGQADFDYFDYFDANGRIYDQIGDPAASQFWDDDDGRRFLKSIHDHILKLQILPVAQRGSIIVDMTGFTDAQRQQVSDYISSLPAARQALITRFGF